MDCEVTGTDLAAVDWIVAQNGPDRSHVISLLQAVQDRYHYLPEDVLLRVSEITGIPSAQLIGVSSFYSQFRFEPTGEHLIRVCHGTACHVKGADRIHDAVRRHLELEEHEHTDKDRRFTVEPVSCLGCCTLSPVMEIGHSVYGYLSPEKVSQAIQSFERSGDRQQGREDAGLQGYTRSDDGEIRIGLGSCCVAKGSDRLREELEKELKRLRLTVPVKRVGCVGMCHRTPLVEVLPNGNKSTLYAQVRPDDARSIVNAHFQPQSFFEQTRLAVSDWWEGFLGDDESEPIDRFSIDLRDRPVTAFLGRQVHIATEHFGNLNPFDLEEYESHEGFSALKKSLANMSPEDVIAEVSASGLRGRGGAGFPTGTKWARVRQSEGDQKYVICNGDEGDPGAFMDRMLLESFPYRVIEGMMIAAYAVGASEGIFYVRAEYPLALRVLHEAIRRLESRGLLGDDILGHGFSFHLRIREGAGAFVSGEETALLAAVEGERSIPRLRPPYPAEKGLWGLPTLINNVETFASVPWILRNGGSQYSAHGTEKSKGTKVFALAGKVARGGLIEVPMGITIREIIEDIGGGVEDGKKLKAVQVGGPSGGCVPASLSNTPIDYDALQSVGAIMGSGGLVVLDETDCMVDIARYFLQFTQNESCGRCTLCRIGSKRMLEIMNRLCEGRGKPGDLDRLEVLSDQMKDGSFCGLGKTAPNPVLTSLRYFRDEYEAHIAGRCPAGRCKALIHYSITPDCIGCTLCAQHCPVNAISGRPYEVHAIDSDICTRCDLCRSVCPEKVVQVA